MRVKIILTAGVLCAVFPAISNAQNIAVNTTGTAAASTNMFEVTQSSTTNNTVGIFATHTGAATNAYAIWAAVTGATNKYAIVVPTGSGLVGFGTTTPSALLDVVYAGTTNTYASKILHSGNASSPGTGLAVSNGYPTSSSSGSYEIFGVYANSFANRLVTVRDNGNVGIATSSPQTTLHVVSSIPTSTANLHPYRTGLIVEGDQNTYGGRIAIRQANDVSSLTLFRSNGTIAAPTTMISGDVMGRISFGGYDGSVVNSFFGMNAVAAENWTSTAHGSHVTFNTVNIGAGWGGTEKVRITSEGNMGIGTTTPGTVPGWTQLSNMRVLEVSGDGTAGTFTDGLLMLSNNRATATVGDQVGALCFTHKNNPGNFPAVICAYLTGAGGANGFGTKLEFHTKANNVLGHLLRMEIDQNGYVGIGKASPTSHVDIYDALSGVTTLTSIKDFTGIGNTSAAFIGGIDFGKTNTGIYVLQKDNIGFATSTTYLLNVVENGSSKMVVTGQGNVGIGTLPGEIFTVHVAADQNIGMQSIGGIPTLLAHNDAWNAWQDIGLGNNILVVKSTGRVGIGTTNPCANLDVVGTANVSSNIYCQGTIYAGWGGGSLACPSDIRFKKDIKRIHNSLNGVLQLEGVTYFFKSDEFPEKHLSQDKQVGLIAQDVEKIFPDLVQTDSNGYKSIDYTRLTPILVEAMKEQQNMIDQLKNDKAVADARIEKLEKMVGLLVQTSQK